MTKYNIPMDGYDDEPTVTSTDGPLQTEAEIVGELMNDAPDSDSEAELAALDGAEDIELLDETEEEVEDVDVGDDSDGHDDREEDAPASAAYASVPVDMTKEEYVAAFTAFNKLFGTLRSFSMMGILVLVYVVITVGSTVAIFAQTGEWDLMMLLLSAVTIATGTTTLTVVRRRVTRSAMQTYDAGNVDGYYGEITVTPHKIEKTTYDGTVSIPLDENTLYVEDASSMQFVSRGISRGIVIPSRCATEALSSAVRQAVFAPDCRVRRHVLRRMPSLAETPIARRGNAPRPAVIDTVTVRYEPEEIKKIAIDAGWKNFVSSLPVLGSFSLLCGMLMAMMEENAPVPVFFVTAVAMMLGLFVLSMFSARNKAKAAVNAPNALSMVVELSDYGVTVVASSTADAAENRVLTRWQTLTRAVERADCVELIGAGRMIRIPKRCITDLEGFCRTVDAHYPPKP